MCLIYIKEIQYERSRRGITKWVVIAMNQGLNYPFVGIEDIVLISIW